MDITIKVTRKPDTKALSAIHTVSFYRGWSPDYIRESLRIKGTMAIVAHQNMGFAVLRCAGDEARILTVAVRPDALRQGIGRAVLNAALREANRRKAKTVAITVNERNAAALSLYTSMGFVPTGRLMHHYANPDGTRSHALAMHHCFTT